MSMTEARKPAIDARTENWLNIRVFFIFELSEQANIINNAKGISHQKRKDGKTQEIHNGSCASNSR